MEKVQSQHSRHARGNGARLRGADARLLWQLNMHPGGQGTTANRHALLLACAKSMPDCFSSSIESWAYMSSLSRNSLQKAGSEWHRGDHLSKYNMCASECTCGCRGGTGCSIQTRQHERVSEREAAPLLQKYSQGNNRVQLWGA